MKKKFKNRIMLALGILIILLIEPISNLISNLGDNDEILVKNEYLMRENDTLKEEVAKLKEIYELKKTDSELIIAKVITRNIYNFYDELIIDKGKNEGISKGDSIISQDGFIGVVKEVREDDSIITLITNKKLNVSVKVNGTYGNFNDGVVSEITSQVQINVGDKVYTSGLTNIKEGLYIGKVEKIVEDKQDIAQRLDVDVAFKVGKINYVGVVK